LLLAYLLLLLHLELLVDLLCELHIELSLFLTTDCGLFKEAWLQSLAAPASSVRRYGRDIWTLDVWDCLEGTDDFLIKLEAIGGFRGFSPNDFFLMLSPWKTELTETLVAPG